jgi:hypothetical protein
MSKKRIGDFRNSPFAGALADLKLPAEEQDDEVRTDEVQDVEEGTDDKSGCWSIYDDMTEREEKEYREQQKGDRKVAIRLFENNIKALEQYSNDEEVVLWERIERIDRTDHSKARIRVGEARRYAHQQLEQIKADTELELNYHSVLQSSEWSVDTKAKINQYPKQRFGNAYKFTR